MALLTADTFNRTNSTSVIGSTDGAGSLDPKAWVAIVGTWGINTNQGYSSALSTGRSIVYQDLATADIDLSITVPTFNAGSSLMFRYVDNSNFWVWVYFDQLWKVVAGSFIAKGTTHAGGANGDIYRVVANGSTIEAYRNGSLLETQTDSFNNTATKHGLYTESTAARYDTWSASSISTTTTVTGTQATETDSATSGTASVTVQGPTPTLTYSLDTPSAATVAGYMVLE